MKTKKPSAIIYGWYKQGEEILISDVYFEEGLEDEVIVYGLPPTDDVVADYTKYQSPDEKLTVHDWNKIFGSQKQTAALPLPASASRPPPVEPSLPQIGRAHV